MSGEPADVYREIARVHRLLGGTMEDAEATYWLRIRDPWFWESLDRLDTRLSALSEKGAQG